MGWIKLCYELTKVILNSFVIIFVLNLNDNYCLKQIPVYRHKTHATIWPLVSMLPYYILAITNKFKPIPKKPQLLKA